MRKGFAGLKATEKTHTRQKWTGLTDHVKLQNSVYQKISYINSKGTQ